jgi:hypothetical protein
MQKSERLAIIPLMLFLNFYAPYVYSLDRIFIHKLGCGRQNSSRTDGGTSERKDGKFA